MLGSVAGGEHFYVLCVSVEYDLIKFSVEVKNNLLINLCNAKV